MIQASMHAVLFIIELLVNKKMVERVGTLF